MFDRLTSGVDSRKRMEEIKNLEKKLNGRYCPKINNSSHLLERNIDDLFQWKIKLERKKSETEKSFHEMCLNDNQPKICETSEIILKEKKGGYLSKRVEDRLIEQGEKTKAKKEEQKEHYIESVTSNNLTNLPKRNNGYKNVESRYNKKEFNVKFYESPKKKAKNEKFTKQAKPISDKDNRKHLPISNSVFENKMNIYKQQIISPIKENIPIRDGTFNQNDNNNTNRHNFLVENDNICFNSTQPTNLKTKNIIHDYDYLMEIRKHLKTYYDHKSKYGNNKCNQNIYKSNSSIIVSDNIEHNKANSSLTLGTNIPNNKSKPHKINLNEEELTEDKINDQMPQCEPLTKDYDYYIGKGKLDNNNLEIKQDIQIQVPLSSLTSSKPLPKYKYQPNPEYQYSIKQNNNNIKDNNNNSIQYSSLNYLRNNNIPNIQTIEKDYIHGESSNTNLHNNNMHNNNCNQRVPSQQNIFNFNEDIFHRNSKSVNRFINTQQVPNNKDDILGTQLHLNSSACCEQVSFIQQPNHHRLQDLEQMRNFALNLKPSPNTINFLQITNNSENNVSTNISRKQNNQIPFSVSKTSCSISLSQDVQKAKIQIYGKKILQGQFTSFNNNSPASVTNMCIHSNIPTNENRHFDYFDYYQNNSYISPQLQNPNNNYVSQKPLKTEENANNNITNIVTVNKGDEQTLDYLNEKLKLNEKNKIMLYEKLVNFEPSINGHDYKNY